MNLFFLPFGPWGVVLAAMLSLVGGVLFHGLAHAWGRRHGWTHAGEIGRAWLITMLVTAGADAWNLFYMGIVPLQSPATIQRLLSSIHDPDTLGVRVACEFIGACAGVMLGWLLWAHDSQPCATVRQTALLREQPCAEHHEQPHPDHDE